MYDFDVLIEEVLKNKPELSRELLMEQIEEKKNTVGSGYLTDQGALFLIAGELGVHLERVTSTDLRLKDLYVGANDITIVARVFAIYPSNEYERRDGTGRGRYRRIGLFDSANVARLTLWDERVEDVEQAGVTIDSPVRIVNGYVKQGLDGKPNLNLGRRGRIEKIEDAELSSKLEGIEIVAGKLGSLSDDQVMVALDATLASEPRRSDFTRADRSAGSLLQFRVSRGGGGREEERRIAIWDPSIPTPSVKVGQRIRVTNLRAKKSLQGEPELHGDAGSIVIPLEAERRARVFRVVSTDHGETPRVLAVDEGKRVYQLEFEDDAAVSAKSVKLGDIIRVIADQDLKEKLVCRSNGSFEVSSEAMPESDSLGVKIEALKTCAWPVMVESIALSRGAVQEVHLKDGSVVKKGEITIGDDTAEVKLVAWRELAGKVMSIEPGERVRVVGAKPQISKMGILTLQMSDFAKIERRRGR